MKPIYWDVDPVWFELGGAAVRYYGIFFGLALVTGYLIWYRRVRRYGHSVAFGESFLLYTVPAVFIGGRLGYCLFYRPATYLADPLRILMIWEGGLASHGVALGLAAALWLISRRYQVSWLQLGDYFAPAVALAVGWVRLGNFFNSEVIGRPASVPWAVVFARRDDIPRHPAQLYDLMIGPITWLVLTAVERRSTRPMGSGVIAGTFLVVYFGLRIWVEQYKDFYVEDLRSTGLVRLTEDLIGQPIHTGQLLSVVPVLAGVIVLVRAQRTSR